MNFKRFLKALGIAILGFFYDVRISRKGRVSLRLRDNQREKKVIKKIHRDYKMFPSTGEPALSKRSASKGDKGVGAVGARHDVPTKEDHATK